MDLLGTRLGRYELRERLGKGGMAQVYKAWDTNLDRWVAVKVLHDYLAEETDFKARFEREAKVVAALNHPNIVQVYDYDVTERAGQSVCYMVMRYIPGITLRQRMEAGVPQNDMLTMTEIAHVMAGVCGALQYAHAQGMVHRDVTPGNILFDDQGNAVLADFGIARMVQSQRVTQSGTTSGTPLYMAPEQGLGEAGDSRSDIYSLGVILFEMLIGKTPYESESAVAVLLKHVNDPIPSILERNASLPVGLERVVMTALAKEPDQRYQTAMQMLDAFQQAIGGSDQTRKQDLNRTVMLNEQLPTKKPSTTPRRNLALPLGIGAALAIFLIGGALVFSLQPRAGDISTIPTLAVPTGKSRSFAPSMTTVPMTFAHDFNDLDPEANFWLITTDDPDIYRNIEDGSYHIRHAIPAAAVTTIFYPAATYGPQYIYEADLTISDQCTPDTASGIVFRFRSDDQYYVFAVNGMGQVSLWARSDGKWTELRGLDRNWTDAAAVNKLGKSNHLKLIDDGKTLTAFVNDTQVIEIEQDQPLWESGSIGVYLASSVVQGDNTPYAEVFVDNFSASELNATTGKSVPAPAPADS
ncbi:MAG: protein kinase [Anaerolineae bacterium]|nr:protein kinase [Anaerolineae bacterium]